MRKNDARGRRKFCHTISVREGSSLKCIFLSKRLLPEGKEVGFTQSLREKIALLSTGLRLYVVERFSANFSENFSEADSGRQQREIQNRASLLVQLSITSMFNLSPKKPALFFTEPKQKKTLDGRDKFGPYLPF